MDISNIANIITEMIRRSLLQQREKDSYLDDLSIAMWKSIKPIFISKDDMNLLEKIKENPEKDINFEVLKYKINQLIENDPEAAKRLNLILDEELEKLKHKNIITESSGSINVSIGNSIGLAHSVGKINMK